jgi:hypothetical protein
MQAVGKDDGWKKSEKADRWSEAARRRPRTCLAALALHCAFAASQRCRRTFTEQVPICARKTPELEEAKLGRHSRDRSMDGAGHLKRMVRGLEAAPGQVLFRAEAAHVMKGVAQRALADTSGAAEIDDLNGLTGAVGHEVQRAPNDLRAGKA